MSHLLESKTPSEGFFKTFYSEARSHVAKIAEDTDPVYQSSQAPISEKSMYSVWAGQQIRKHGLQTTGGRDIQIVAPGWWSPGPGPDFARAEILLDSDHKRTGDVEIHLRSSDWEAHGHHTDPTYNNVILHIVLHADRHDRGPLRHDGEAIPEIALINYLTIPLSESIDEAEKESSGPRSSEPGACTGTLSAWPPGKISSLLDLAGDERALLKARLVEREARVYGYPQATFVKVMEALGYTPNRRPFRDLAQLLTEDLLHQHASSMPEHAAETVMEALFFGAANLFPQQLPLPHSDRETGAYLAELVAVWKTAGEREDLAVMERREWNLRGLRPANNPRRRLSGMAHLAVRHKEKKLFGAMLDHLTKRRADAECSGESRIRPDLFRDMLTVPAEGYWSRRYDFGATPLKRPTSLIGAERVGILLVNAVIPSLLAHCRDEGHTEAEANLHHLYTTLPSSPPNRTLRFMSGRMFGADTVPRHLKLNARRQQGLIQVYHDFCSVHEGGCTDCLFPQLLNHL